MADNRTLREALRASRGKEAKAAAELVRARELSRQAVAEAAHVARWAKPDDPRRLAAQRRAEAARGDLEKRESDYGKARQGVKEALQNSSGITDPTAHVAQLSRHFPILLLPLRIETRFKPKPGATASRILLQIRVFPDECAIDSFEPSLSATEVENATAFWINMWRAGGIEEQERAAWRALVESHGSGRAAWLVRQMQPRNMADKPTKVYKTDIILTIATSDPPRGLEAVAIAAYWREVWAAQGDRHAEAHAWARLRKVVLSEQRAEVIRDKFKPANLTEKPASGMQLRDVRVSSSFVVLPTNVITRGEAWSEPARVDVLPDRLVAIGYAGRGIAFMKVGEPIPWRLLTGVDPRGGSAGVKRDGADLVFGSDLQWLFDFGNAVQNGMGFEVDLPKETADAGINRLIVVGVKLTSDESASKDLLKTLIEHHKYSSKGFALVPQGTPTNNTAGTPAGFSRDDNPDATFDLCIKGASSSLQSTEEGADDWLSKRDGQWFADGLGIDPTVLRDVAHFGGTDMAEARAMNVALWPATWGYMLQSMLFPILTDEDIRRAHWFFTNFVSGRGMLPSLRIGNQPYGVLAVTNLEAATWGDEADAGFPGLVAPAGVGGFLNDLRRLLGKAAVDWDGFAESVPRVGAPGDPHANLLGILGHHPTSVEYYQRFFVGVRDVHNRATLLGKSTQLSQKLEQQRYSKPGMDLLARFGYTGTAPSILRKLPLSRQQLLTGSLVTARPGSEVAGLGAATRNGLTYLQWLRHSAMTSLDVLRLRQGLLEEQSPTALLFLMLRHALLLGYSDACVRLYKANGLPVGQQEADFIHVRTDSTKDGRPDESRLYYLYRPEARVTGSESVLLADYISRNVSQLDACKNLADQMRALEVLEQMPTARLEMAFAEHLDCCSYRLDAWQTGLANHILATLRYGNPVAGQAGAKTGLYIGAYGWLEGLHPGPRTLQQASLSGELASVFGQTTGLPIMEDPANGGYVHTPALDQAQAAAVLRAGYLAHASSANPNSFAVDLSSERVRSALALIEGIQSNQSLGALLGYRLERDLHGRYGVAEVDRFIYRLRKAFPLQANRLQSTLDTNPDADIRVLEARNVVDGEALVMHLQGLAEFVYPFGIKELPTDDTPEKATDEEKQALGGAMKHLVELHDTVADVAMAEAVYQAVRGNFDRVAANVDAYSKATSVPTPEVVATPRSAIRVAHRVALQLDGQLDRSGTPEGKGTPRAKAEPALNDWLRKVLPSASHIGWQVEYTKPPDPAVHGRTVTLSDLGLDPIDLIYLAVGPSSSQLEDRVRQHVRRCLGEKDARHLRPDATITIKQLPEPGGVVGIFELLPLLRSLRALAESRPLQPRDLVPIDEPADWLEQPLFAEINARRLEATVADATALQQRIATWVADRLAPVLEDSEQQRDRVLDEIDLYIEEASDLLSEAAAYALPQAAWESDFVFKAGTFRESLARVRILTERWTQALSVFDELLAQYEQLGSNVSQQERLNLLRRAEIMISTSVAAVDGSADALLLHLKQLRRRFSERLEGFRGLAGTTEASLAVLLKNIRALLPVEEFDREGIETADLDTSVIRHAESLLARLRSVTDELRARISKASAAIAACNASTNENARGQALQAAAKALLGDEFQIIPVFSLSNEQRAELAAAVRAGRDGRLFEHLRKLGRVLVMDEWLHGIARVRQKLQNWEQAMIFAGGFGGSELALEAAQLPYQEDGQWLGMEIPYADEALEGMGDRVLYTAHYAVDIDVENGRTCGLMLDEWQEEIPFATKTTGLAFHYDGPNSEPPQAWLLAVPPRTEGNWSWQDVVGAVNNALDLAKRRAVEPAQLDRTAYTRFLPATMSPVCQYGISITLNYAENDLAGGDGGAPKVGA